MAHRWHITLIALALSLWGCASQDDQESSQRWGATSSRQEWRVGDRPPGQKYEYGAVKQRLPQLRKGMTHLDVMIRLGSPAHESDAVWVYLPNRPGVILPSEALKVRFENGRYVKHSFQPVILGERLDAEALLK